MTNSQAAKDPGGGAVDNLTRFSVDIAFIGANGLTDGITVPE